MLGVAEEGSHGSQKGKRRLGARRFSHVIVSVFGQRSSELTEDREEAAQVSSLPSSKLNIHRILAYLVRNQL